MSVRCAAACDVRAFIPDHGATSAAAAASLPGGRQRVLRLRPSTFDDVLPRRRGRVTVRARVSAPGSPATRTPRLHVRLARRPSLPVPRPLDARAVRRGRSIVVTWRTAFPARRVSFIVRPPAAPGSPDLAEARPVVGRGRTRFKLTLRPDRPSRLRRLVIEGTDYEGGQKRSVTIPVTG